MKDTWHNQRKIPQSPSYLDDRYDTFGGSSVLGNEWTGRPCRMWGTMDWGRMMNRGGQAVGGEAFTEAIQNDESWRRNHSWEVISNLSKCELLGKGS